MFIGNLEVLKESLRWAVRRLFAGGTKEGLGEELTLKEGRVRHKLGPKTLSPFHIEELIWVQQRLILIYQGQSPMALILESTGKTKEQRCKQKCRFEVL